MRYGGCVCITCLYLIALHIIVFLGSICKERGNGEYLEYVVSLVAYICSRDTVLYLLVYDKSVFLGSVCIYVFSL